MIIERSETKRVMIPGRGASEWNLKIGISAKKIEIPIIVKAILLPRLKSIKTIRIQQKELIAAIAPCIERIGIVKEPKARVLPGSLVIVETKY